jgi:anthranilate phosphoribosyltransferase
MKGIINKLKKGLDLEEGDVIKIVDLIEQNTFDKEEMKTFLLMMNEKGINSDELFFFVNELYKKANKIDLGDDLIDVCGTGGDNMHTFNISTASMFVVAGAGVKIAKHGNKAVSSSSGSFDVLSELGINVNNCGALVKETLKETNIALFFAPAHHPVFKNIGDVRRELGQKTIFNIMGPLLNPCGVKRQLIGVYDETKTELIAKTMQKKGIIHGMVVNGNGLDEITIDGETKISELRNEYIKTYKIKPKTFGITKSTISDIVVSDKEESASIILSVLDNEDSPARDIVILNSGAAIYVSGKAKSMGEGVKLAKHSLSSGMARGCLNKLRKVLE